MKVKEIIQPVLFAFFIQWRASEIYFVLLHKTLAYSYYCVIEFYCWELQLFINSPMIDTLSGISALYFIEVWFITGPDG